jgi:hypothetical protein
MKAFFGALALGMLVLGVAVGGGCSSSSGPSCVSDQGGPCGGATNCGCADTLQCIGPNGGVVTGNTEGSCE